MKTKKGGASWQTKKLGRIRGVTKKQDGMGKFVIGGGKRYQLEYF
jgi:hypothetical protein